MSEAGKRRSARRAVGIAVALALLVLSLPMVLPQGASGPSVRSRASDGLLGARLVLEDWNTTIDVVEVGATALSAETEGADVVVETRWSLDAVPVEKSVVVAFPASRAVLPIASDLDRRVRAGSKALLAYSGTLLAFEEIGFFADLGVALEPSPSRGSMAPWQWWMRQRRGERFELSRVNDDVASQADRADGALGSALQSQPFVADRLGAMPVPEEGCERVTGTATGPRAGSGGKVAAAMRCTLGEGVLWLVPTSSLANARIENAGNLEVLWRIRQDLGDAWSVLEASQTAVAGAATGNVRSARATLNSMAAQLALLYLGAVLALAWSFGPRWSEARHPPDGHRGFLLGLGALHQKLGQFASAAEMLRKRWLEYDPMARRRGLTELANVSSGEPGEISEEQLVEWAQGASRRRSDSVMPQQQLSNNSAITQQQHNAR